MQNSIENGLQNSNDFVYHYTKMTSGFENILAAGQLKFGVFEKTNDPIEYNHKFSGYDVDENESETIKNALVGARKIVEQKLLKETYFLSTCKSNGFDSEKHYGYLKLRMWSQYGEDHKGICFVLSKSEIKKEIRRVVSGGSFLTYFGSVCYSYRFDQVYTNSMFHYSSINANDPEEIAIKYIEKEYKRLFFRKYRDYRDEEEYRFVIVNKEHSYKEISINLAPVLRGIIIGDHQNSNYIGAYNHYKNRYQVPVYKAKWHGGRFELISI